MSTPVLSPPGQMLFLAARTELWNIFSSTFIVGSCFILQKKRASSHIKRKTDARFFKTLVLIRVAGFHKQFTNLNDFNRITRLYLRRLWMTELKYAPRRNWITNNKVLICIHSVVFFCASVIILNCVVLSSDNVCVIKRTKPMRTLYRAALALWCLVLAHSNMSLKDFCIWYLSMRLCLKDQRGMGLKREVKIILTCLKVVWGAPLAPVSSMYSSQLNSASSSMLSASGCKHTKNKNHPSIMSGSKEPARFWG